MTTESMLDLCHPLLHILNLAILSGPTGRVRMCCRSKPTGEQRRATRRAGRLLVRWQALLPRRRPAIPSRARRMCESRACHLTYTRSHTSQLFALCLFRALSRNRMVVVAVHNTRATQARPSVSFKKVTLADLIFFSP